MAERGQASGMQTDRAMFLDKRRKWDLWWHCLPHWAVLLADNLRQPVRALQGFHHQGLPSFLPTHPGEITLSAGSSSSLKISVSLCLSLCVFVSVSLFFLSLSFSLPVSCLLNCFSKPAHVGRLTSVLDLVALPVEWEGRKEGKEVIE